MADVSNIEVFFPNAYDLPIPVVQLSAIEAFGVQLPPIVPVPSVVANFDPVVAGVVTSDRAVSFDVTNPGSFLRIVILVQFPNLSIYDVAHDGSRFGDRYLQSQFNTKVAIANGFRFTLLRKDGWPTSPRIIPIATSLDGAENPVESVTYAWTLI